MEVRPEILLIILGTGLVTVIPRVLPMVLLRRIPLPQPVLRWLGFVPIAVIASLLAQEILTPDGHLALPPDNLEILAAIPALVAAFWTRSLIVCVAVGMATIVLLRLLF
jgi:branched-subunit amino acid transport protein